LPPSRSGQRSHKKIGERGARMCAAALPASDNIVAFGDEIRGAPEIEIGERLAEIGHERLDVGMAPTRRMQRILQEHVGSGELVNDAEIAGLTPEVCKPVAYD